MKKTAGIITGLATTAVILLGSSAYSMTEDGNKLILKALNGSPKTTEIYEQARERLVENIADDTSHKKIVLVDENGKIIEEEATNPDTATTKKTPKKGFFVIKDPKTGETIATSDEQTPEKLGDDPKITQINEFTTKILKEDKEKNLGLKSFIERTQKQAIRVIQGTLSVASFSKSFATVNYKLPVNYEKRMAIIQEMADFYKKTLPGFSFNNTQMLAKKVALQEKAKAIAANTIKTKPEKVIASNTKTEKPTGRITYKSVADDDVAEAKANVEKSLTQGRAKVLAAAKNYVAIGGNPADIKGWEEISKELNITPDDL